jgi:hypothetical protein
VAIRVLRKKSAQAGRPTPLRRPALLTHLLRGLGKKSWVWL